MTAPDPRLVALLGEHAHRGGYFKSKHLRSAGGWVFCACGARLPVEPYGSQIQTHRAHLAAEVEAHVQTRIAEARESAVPPPPHRPPPLPNPVVPNP